MGGSSNDKVTETSVDDKRIGATEGAIVAGEDSELTIHSSTSSADAAVITAAIQGAVDFAKIDQAEHRAADEAALGHAQGQLAEVLKSGTVLAGFGLAAVVAVLVFGRR